MKMMKKLLIIAFSVTMLLGIVLLGVSEKLDKAVAEIAVPRREQVENRSQASQGLEYELSSDGTSYSISGVGACTDSKVVIPSKYNGLPVTKIGNRAFTGYTNLTEVEIPDSVTWIGLSAFSGCINLTEVEIPDSVTLIGGWAFCGCYGLREIVVPGSLRNTNASVFMDCYGLKKAVILNGVIVINTSMFSGCSNLTEVEIPTSVICIADYAFKGCTSLTNITFRGTQERWDTIQKGTEWNHLVPAREVVCLGESVEESEKYTIRGRKFDNNIDYYTANCVSTEYNPTLSNMLAALAASAYNEKEIKSAYRALKFSNIECREYDSQDTNKCGFTVAIKESEYNTDRICLITIRGTVGDFPTSPEWQGDFDIRTTEEKHNSFYHCANNIYHYIKTYIKINLSDEITSDTIKYVITGHSRGAAAGNLLAVELMENGVKAENVYDYNYACPDVACKIIFPTYNNIFNLCNRIDIVTKVPGVICSAFSTIGYSWGKFGKTYWFTKGANTMNPLMNHDGDLYLEFFDQKLAYEDWSKTWGDVKDDFRNLLLGVIAKISCPVDVIVTDEAGNKVAAVINGRVQYYDGNVGEVVVFTDGDRKIVYFTGGKNFNINLVATDDGTMTYSVEKFDLDTGETSETKMFNNVQLEEGKTMCSPIGKEQEPDDVKLFIVEEKEGKIVFTHTIETDGTETILPEESNGCGGCGGGCFGAVGVSTCLALMGMSLFMFIKKKDEE